ncbi:carbonic anhydrase [Prolixibacteraceae bacterium]|nr:carbonic anhydrase [Prolixibacteraceae bacterium]
MENLNILNGILHNNETWALDMKEHSASVLEENGKGQSPQVLWIGCADSRVPPGLITESKPGSIFVHRNIANVVEKEDESLNSVLEYALFYLKVKLVVVCGHYDCGGVKAALSGDNFTPYINKWIAPIHNELQSLQKVNPTHEELIEAHTKNQLAKLTKHPIAQKAKEDNSALEFVGLVYDPASGKLKKI